MLRDILQVEVSSEILNKKSRELTVDEIKSDEIQLLIQEMKQVMRNAPGVGLAAPQIGVSIQLAVIEDSNERLKDLSSEVLLDRSRVVVPFHVIINPQITHMSGKINYFFEGCLSVKGRARVTPRSHFVTVKCLDENGNQKVINAEGWYARILQHEIDHLNGKLYVDLSDSRTEVLTDDSYKKTWMNASSKDIVRFFKEKCPDCGVDVDSYNDPSLKY